MCVSLVKTKTSEDKPFASPAGRSFKEDLSDQVSVFIHLLFQGIALVLRLIRYLPLNPSGTRHEYRQVPLQPNPKNPNAHLKYMAPFLIGSIKKKQEK